jgi:hypothetical protein
MSAWLDGDAVLASETAIDHCDVCATVNLDHPWLNVSEGQVHACVAHGNHWSRLLYNLHNAMSSCDELVHRGQGLRVDDVHAAILVAV